MVVSRWSLVVGCWSLVLVVRHWSFVISRSSLVVWQVQSRLSCWIEAGISTQPKTNGRRPTTNDQRLRPMTDNQRLTTTNGVLSQLELRDRLAMDFVRTVGQT